MSPAGSNRVQCLWDVHKKPGEVKSVLGYLLDALYKQLSQVAKDCSPTPYFVSVKAVLFVVMAHSDFFQLLEHCYCSMWSHRWVTCVHASAILLLNWLVGRMMI